MGCGIGRARGSIKVNELGKDRMQVSRALEGERVTYAARIFMVFEVMLEFADVSEVRSLAMSALIAHAGR